MKNSVFAEIQFWLLIVFSFVLPAGLYGTLIAKRAISPRTVLAFALILVAVAGIDVYLLQYLATEAKLTTSLADDAVFRSEITVALYLVPALFAGTGINLVSHALIRHLTEAEKRFEEEHGRR